MMRNAAQRLETGTVWDQTEEPVALMLSGLAHEFNNYLGAITGAVELAMDEIPENSQAREDLRVALQATEKASQMVKQMAAFSPRRNPPSERVDLNQCLRDLAPVVEKLLPVSHTLTLDLEEKPLPIFLPPTFLEQILMNLIINARDAMPEGGTITTRSRCDGGQVVVEVEDQGEGIPLETIERVFEPFFSTKGIGKGSGLGLALSRHLAQRVGGSLEVESRMSQGSRFFLRLPLCSE